MKSRNQRTSGVRLALILSAIIGVAGLLSVTSLLSLSAHVSAGIQNASNSPSQTYETYFAPASPSYSVKLEPSSSASSQVTSNTEVSEQTPTRTPNPSSAKPSSSKTPKPTACPISRNENPKLWDACRAGYIPPKIVFVGLVSCVATDDTKKNWLLTYEFALEGGNFRKVSWSNDDGRWKVWIKGYPLEGVNDMYPLTASAEVGIAPMNGLSGLIDMLEFNQEIDVPIGRFCH